MDWKALLLKYFHVKHVSSPCVVILGMHRSGTSCLAGSLQAAGVYLGGVHEWSAHNTKGNREHQEIVSLNDEVLATNGCEWHTVSLIKDKKLRWTREQSIKRDALIARLSSEQKAQKAACWGFKDPRVLFTLPFWQEAIPDMQFIGTYRHPLAVARSIHARSLRSHNPDDLIPIANALSIWQLYNERLLLNYKQAAFPLLNFDQSGDTYLADLEKVVARIGLSLDQESVRSFFEPELRHQSGSDADAVVVPAEVDEIYQRLHRHYRDYHGSSGVSGHA